MEQGRRAEARPGPEAQGFPAGQAVQLVIEQGKQLIGRRRVGLVGASNERVELGLQVGSPMRWRQ